MNQFYQPYGYNYSPTSKARDSLAWYWIQGGEEMARNWYVSPGQTVALWDSAEQVIYLKSTDQTGRPTIETLDYTRREGAPSTSENYVTREEFNKLLKSFEALQDELTTPTKKEEKK